jgi:mono/diheme cytochrome c family protein
MPRILCVLALALFATALAAQPSDLPGGAALYRNHCAPCHGADGEGGGPAARALRTTVPSLRSLAQRNGGVFPSEAVTAYIDGREIRAAHGDEQMPIWGDVFRGPQAGTGDEVVRARIAALVEFIKALQSPAPPR